MPDERKPEIKYKSYIRSFLAGRNYTPNDRLSAEIEVGRLAERDGVLKSQNDELFLRVFNELFERRVKHS